MESSRRGDREAVRNVVFGALEELNSMRPAADRFPLDEATVLGGGDGGLDSLALVNLVVALEQRLQSELGSTFSLTEPEVVERWPEIFATTASLIDSLHRMVGEHGRC